MKTITLNIPDEIVEIIDEYKNTFVIDSDEEAINKLIGLFPEFLMLKGRCAKMDLKPNQSYEIELINVHFELGLLGIKSGDRVIAESNNTKTGAMYFDIHHSGIKMNCVVYPEDYKIVNK